MLRHLLKLIKIIMNPTFTVTKKDLTLTWFSGSGGGGQYRNKHSNCCRIKHNETGIISTGQSHRERPANQKEALEGLVRNPRFRAFCERGLIEMEQGEKAEERAERITEELMKPENFHDIDDKELRLLTRGKKREVIKGVEVWS